MKHDVADSVCDDTSMAGPVDVPYPVSHQVPGMSSCELLVVVVLFSSVLCGPVLCYAVLCCGLWSVERARLFTTLGCKREPPP